MWGIIQTNSVTVLFKLTQLTWKSFYQQTFQEMSTLNDPDHSTRDDFLVDTTRPSSFTQMFIYGCVIANLMFSFMQIYGAVANIVSNVVDRPQHFYANLCVLLNKFAKLRYCLRELQE